MTSRVALIGLTLALCPVPSALADGPISIRRDHDGSGRTIAIAILGLSPSALDALEAENRTAEDWARTLIVEVDSGSPRPADRPAMLGTYRVERGALVFRPRFPMDPGRTYRTTYRRGAGPDEIVWNHRFEKPPRPATTLTRVDPPGDRLPENLLKFYLHFSSPMGRGEAYKNLHLVGEDGKPVDRPFLELGEELWDPAATRLTILLDPGRIKRGLRPREEFGPILEAGRSYTLLVDAAWRDAEGNPLVGPFRKTFRAEATDDIQPNPANWAVDRPPAATLGPIVVTLPEPLDRALLESGIDLIDAQDRPVSGRAEVDLDQRRWRFTPERAWVDGDYRLLIDSDLEDLAGNSVRRPFEVDIQRDTPARPEARTVSLPIKIGGPSRN